MHFSAGDTSIQSLGTPLNTPGWDGDFFVARDESYIIMSANETKTYECELHISFHKPDGGWTTPVSLGPLINDGLAHRWGGIRDPGWSISVLHAGHGAGELSSVLGAVRQAAGADAGAGGVRGPVGAQCDFWLIFGYYENRGCTNEANKGGD